MGICTRARAHMCAYMPQAAPSCVSSCPKQYTTTQYTNHDVCSLGDCVSTCRRMRCTHTRACCWQVHTLQTDTADTTNTQQMIILCCWQAVRGAVGGKNTNGSGGAHRTCRTLPQASRADAAHCPSTKRINLCSPCSLRGPRRGARQGAARLRAEARGAWARPGRGEACGVSETREC